jgi:hypothetical protein
MATNRGLEKLSATAVAKARHRAKPYKLADGGGLYSSSVGSGIARGAEMGVVPAPMDGRNLLLLAGRG